MAHIDPHPGFWEGRRVKRTTTLLITVLMLASLPAASAAATRTSETVFQAFRPDAKPAIYTTSRSGSCFSGALTIDRDDAGRCSVGNYLYDPCFSSTHAPGVVVCPGPELRAGVEITLTRGLPRRYVDAGRPSLSHQPWNIELGDGQHCEFDSGATTILDGDRLNYSCGPGGNLALWGYPRRSAEPWTILAAPYSAKRLHQRRAIRHVWM